MSQRRRSPSAREVRVGPPALDLHGVEDEIGFVLRLAQLAVFKDVIETLSPSRRASVSRTSRVAFRRRSIGW